MANSWFQFKQFRIEQDRCAMKVCTDACVLGASADLRGARRLLDIGAGTGLLALMAAQRTTAATQIDAVELEAAAAAQAAANFAASPWAARLTLHPLSLQAFAATQPLPYDHLLCNPPFFRHALPSPDAARTTARHATADTLPFSAICQFAAAFLTPNGCLTVLLPPPEMRVFEREAAAVGLYPASRLLLSHRPGSKPSRHITAFGRQPRAVAQRHLFLHEENGGTYSAAFRELLRDFYLAL